MSDPASKTTNSEDAWWLYYAEEKLDDGMPQGNWVDEAHNAFVAGWQAAMKALKP